MDFILWALNIAWKVVCIAAGFIILKFIIQNGSGTFRELLETISVALKTIGHFIRKTCLGYLTKEKESTKEKPAEPTPTYEEFCEWMKENRNFKL